MTEVVRNPFYSLLMSLSQTTTLDYDDEMKSTRKLLERAPLDDVRRSYQPHRKSMSLARLATHVAELPSWIKMAVDSDSFDLQPGYKPRIAGSTAELLEIFDKNAAEGRTAIAAATDGDMQKSWSFKYGGELQFSDVRAKVIRSFLNHLVHHRA